VSGVGARTIDPCRGGFPHDPGSRRAADAINHAFEDIPRVAEAPDAEEISTVSTYLSALERYGTLMAEELPELYDRGTSSANQDGDEGSTA
jgi:hypothetical protein